MKHFPLKAIKFLRAGNVEKDDRSDDDDDDDDDELLDDDVDGDEDGAEGATAKPKRS